MGPGHRGAGHSQEQGAGTQSPVPGKSLRSYQGFLEGTDPILPSKRTLLTTGLCGAGAKVLGMKANGRDLRCDLGRKDRIYWKTEYEVSEWD